MPETPPALNASSIASLKLVNAALALRTLPLTASHMPTKPAPYEALTPRINASAIPTDRLGRSGNTLRYIRNSATAMMTTKNSIVFTCRRRYAIEPS